MAEQQLIHSKYLTNRAMQINNTLYSEMWISEKSMAVYISVQLC